MTDRRHFLYLNIGHFLDHFFLLIFATAAALTLTREWQLAYGELITYSTAGFIAFGVFSLPAGWLADRWSREGMMAIFFVGIGCSAVGASTAASPIEIGLWLSAIGVFAAIYHPVGLAMVAKNGNKMGLDIAINGVWGNMGVGFAALLTGFLIDNVGWRSAFWVPGFLSVLIGIAYTLTYYRAIFVPFNRTLTSSSKTTASAHTAQHRQTEIRQLLIRISIVIFFTTAVSSVIFQGTTFALPKIFEERMVSIASSGTMIGWLAFIVFAIASFAQIIVGRLLDRHGPKRVFLSVASIQFVFFLLFIGQFDWLALVIALCFMLGAFGQIPINDFMIGKMAKSELRASIFGARYVVSFAVWATVVPLISWVHFTWGFDALFYILAGAALTLILAVQTLPTHFPSQTTHST